MAPMRCPVSCASTSATWNRQSTSRDTCNSAWYSSSVRTTRVGFFSLGFLRPLSGFLSSIGAAPFVLRPRGPVENRHQERQVPLDRPVGHGLARDADPSRAPRADESVPVALGERCRVSVPSEELEEHPRRGPVAPPCLLGLGGRHLFTVDVKKRAQRERLGLGVLLAVQLRPGESRSELVRLRLRLPPVAVLQRPCEPAPVVAPLDLVQAGLGIGKDPLPGSGPIRRRHSCAGLVSCVPSFDSFFDDGLHDLRV